MRYDRDKENNFGKFGREGTRRKHLAWWFLAIVCLVVWGLVVAARFGLVSLDASGASVISGWDAEKLMILGLYLTAINVATFVLFAWDKHVAASGNDYRRRIPEARLLALCLVGGSIGGLVAMHALRHKTMKWHFIWGLPIFAVLDAAVVVFAHLAGLI